MNMGKAYEQGITEGIREAFGSLDADALEQQAMGIPPYLDPDGYDVDLDVLDEQDALLEYEVEQELEDEEIEEELDDLDDEDFDELASEIGNEIGRVAMAMRARQQMSSPGADTFGCGYGAGYLQAMKDMGVHEDLIRQEYGGVFKLVGKGVKGAGQLIGAGLKGVLGDKTLKQQAFEAGRAFREQRLGVPAAATARGGDLPSSDASVEADADHLPPVYVEDSEGLSESIDGEWLDDDDVMFGLHPQDRFGAVCRYGMVGAQPRKRAREAAHKAVQESMTRIKHAGSSQAQPFIEDPTAKPMLFTDGSIWEPVYGKLTAIPCPSCTRTANDAAKYGAAASCVVCSQYGAILIPTSDVDEYMSSPQYGILPLIGLAASAAAPAIAEGVASGKLFPKAGKKLKGWFAKIGKKRSEKQDLDELDDETSEEVEVESDESFGVRVLVPPDWWAKNGR